MGRIPPFMLRHRATASPYLGIWGAYGAPVPDVPCFVRDNPPPSTPTPGAAQLLTYTIVAQLDAPIAVGCLLDLGTPRGTVYVTGVARHDYPGVAAVPEHIEVTAERAAPVVPPAAGGEIVVILRRNRRGDTDRYGNLRYYTSSIEAVAAVRPLSSVERGPLMMGTGRDQVVDLVEVVFEHGTDIGPNDRMRIRGLVYEVDGRPIDQHDPVSGATPGVRVTGRRVAG